MGALLEAGEGTRDAQATNVRLGRWYARVPDPVDAALLGVAERLRTLALHDLVKERWVNAAGSVSVVTYGRAPSVDYFVKSVLGDSPRLVDSTTVGLDSVVPDANADVTIARGPRLRLSRLEKEGWHAVPDVVSLAIDLDGAKTDPPWINRHNSNNIRRIRKYRLHCVHTGEDTELECFLEEYYLPYIRSVFGDEALPRSEHRIWRWFRRGALMWVCEGSRRLSGQVYSVSGDTVFARVIAANPEYVEARRHGALAAAYLFLCEWGLSRGLARVDLGVSRPSLTDGVLFHKGRWGGGLRSEPYSTVNLYFCWPGKTPGAMAMLRKRPLIEWDRGGWAGLTAIPDGMDTSAVRAFLRRIAVRGLRRLRVYADTDTALDDVPIQGLPVQRLSFEDPR